jgi:nucleoside 2-deoxyribosyltransferase
MEKCPITDLELTRVDSGAYRINANGENLFIRHGIRFDALLSQEDFIKNKHIFAGAILTKQLADKDPEDIYWFSLTLDTYMEKLENIVYPKTPKSKLDNLFLSLFQLQKYDGELVKIDTIVPKPEFFYKHFFKSKDECIYYCKELTHQGLITFSIHPIGLPIDFSITFRGLNYFLDLTEKGNLSKKCFLAMSFDPSMKEIRKTIKLVIQKNGFDPIIIDEQIIESSQTINDAIIVAIKSCKFCVADFSQQKDGVYFESGFAVGLEKTVIYTCHEDWFSKSHFDTNHFPHIIYKSTEELAVKLDEKIKAWIK